MITTLTGTNTFLLKRELNKRVQVFLEQHGDMALERIDGEEATYDRLLEALQSQPFLVSNKLVVLSKPGMQKQFAENFADIIGTVPVVTEVLILEPKPDKRSSYYKALKSKTELIEFKEMDGRELASWLVTTAKQAGGSLSHTDALYLVDRVGANQQLLDGELQKLLLYNPKITRATIDLLSEPVVQGTVFQLLEAAFAGNSQRTLQLYNEQRAQQVEPVVIIGMLAWQLHILAIVKAAGEKSPQIIAQEAKLNPYVVQKTQAIARKLTTSEVKQLVHDLHVIDIRMKSESVDADEILQFYLLQIRQATS